MDYASSGCIKRVVLKHCIALNEDGDTLISWPSSLKSEGYIITKYLDDKSEEIWLDGALNTKFIDKTEKKVKYKVEAFKHLNKYSEIELNSLLGSLEQAQLKENINTEISSYIEENYDKLLSFVERLPHIDLSSSALILNDVWFSWIQKEQSGEGYSPERLSRGGKNLTIQQVVENTLKAYAKNQMYTKKYNNKDKNHGVEIELHSVSMLEEREEGSENNFITAQASLTQLKGKDSPLEDMIEICTLKEDLEYVLKATKDFKVPARSILDNYSDLIGMVSDNDETGISPGEEIIRTMNKTLFNEYKSSLDMVDMFDRIFVFMNKNLTLFNEIYNELLNG